MTIDRAFDTLSDRVTGATIMLIAIGTSVVLWSVILRLAMAV